MKRKKCINDLKKLLLLFSFILNDIGVQQESWWDGIILIEETEFEPMCKKKKKNEREKDLSIHSTNVQSVLKRFVRLPPHENKN